MYLFWKDLNPKLRTVRVLSKPDLKFCPKRWEEREVPVPAELASCWNAIPYRSTAPRLSVTNQGIRDKISCDALQTDR